MVLKGMETQNRMVAITELDMIETEISVPRKGSVSVRMDLNHRILSWRESNRWNRNFTRTLNRKEVDHLRMCVRDCHVMHWPMYYPNASEYEAAADIRYHWQLTLYIKDRECIGRWYGVDEAPEDYVRWVEYLSHICRQPLEVLD